MNGSFAPAVVAAAAAAAAAGAADDLNLKRVFQNLVYLPTTSAFNPRALVSVLDTCLQAVLIKVFKLCCVACHTFAFGMQPLFTEPVSSRWSFKPKFSVDCTQSSPCFKMPRASHTLKQRRLCFLCNPNTGIASPRRDTKSYLPIKQQLTLFQIGL